LLSTNAYGQRNKVPQEAIPEEVARKVKEAKQEFDCVALERPVLSFFFALDSKTTLMKLNLYDCFELIIEHIIAEEKRLSCPSKPHVLVQFALCVCVCELQPQFLI